MLETVGAETLVYLSGITLAILPEGGRAALKEALRRCRKAGATIAFDSNIRPRLWEDAATLRAETEAAIFGDADPAATAARYLGLGEAVCVVKDGPGPVTVARPGRAALRIPVAPIPSPVDTTAAGDAFNAAVLAGVIRGNSIQDSIQSACSIATRVVMEKGALVNV